MPERNSPEAQALKERRQWAHIHTRHHYTTSAYGDLSRREHQRAVGRHTDLHCPHCQDNITMRPATR